jgi:hypothetical protein
LAEANRPVWIYGARSLTTNGPTKPWGCVARGEIYKNSGRRYDGGVEELDYGHIATRRVNKNGRINFCDQKLFFSSSLAGWSVGLKADDQERIEVWFAKILLGWIEPSSANFVRADIGPNKNK